MRRILYLMYFCESMKYTPFLWIQYLFKQILKIFGKNLFNVNPIEDFYINLKRIVPKQYVSKIDKILQVIHSDECYNEAYREFGYPVLYPDGNINWSLIINDEQYTKYIIHCIIMKRKIILYYTKELYNEIEKDVTNYYNYGGL